MLYTLLISVIFNFNCEFSRILNLARFVYSNAMLKVFLTLYIPLSLFEY